MVALVTIATGQLVPTSELTYPQISLACTTKGVFESIVMDPDYSDEDDVAYIEDDILIIKLSPNPRN